MRTRYFIKSYIMLFLALGSFIFLNTAFSIDAPTNATSLRYATALIKVNIVSQNYWSGCAQAGTPANQGNGIWYNLYTLCPANSFQSVAPTVDGASMHNCVCNGSCPTGLSKYGNLGLKVSGIKCVVPVSLWLPSTIFSSATSGQTITLFGTQVYASNVGGTQVFIQPSASSDSFNITVEGGSSITGPDAAFLANFITLSMFQNLSVQFQGCKGSTGC